MNEARNVIVGFELNRNGSQICYYDRTLKEPVSVTTKIGTNEYVFPTQLAYREDRKEWVFGVEAEYWGVRPGGILIEDLFSVLFTEEPVAVGRMKIRPDQLLSVFLQLSLGLLGLADPVKNISGICFTTREVTKTFVDNLAKAAADLGFSKTQYSVADEEECYFYYCFSQKREIWSRRMMLYSFRDGSVRSKILDQNLKLRPVVVTAADQEVIPLSEIPAERDQEFLDYAERQRESGGFSAVFLTGDGFSRDWAKKSVSYLCRICRHVYYGENLFVKGACYAMLERKEPHLVKGYLFMGRHRTEINVGMEMKILGNSAYYPLISAGTNWYEAGCECEFLLDGEEDLKLMIRSIDSKRNDVFVMELPGLPKRPDGATRIRLRTWMPDPSHALFAAEDLGFGDFYEATNRKWTEVVEV